MQFKSLLVGLILALLAAQNTKAQHNDFFNKNWQVGASGGLSYLTMELYKDFSGSMVEMNSKAAGTYNLYIYKTLHRTFDLGVTYSGTFFNGYRNNPSNVNWLYRSRDFNTSEKRFQPFPIEYRTNLSSLHLKAIYHLSPFYSLRKSYSNVNMFFSGAVGWSSIGVELSYVNEANYDVTGMRKPLFAKGYGYATPRSDYVSFQVGSGINYQISPRLAFQTEVTVTMVNADYLDGVHNYTAAIHPESTNEEMLQNRVQVYDVVGGVTVGLLYHFNVDNPNSYKKHTSLWQHATRNHKNPRYYPARKFLPKRDKLPFAK